MNDVDKNFESYRIIFAVYNMHYYVNIFLLAVMSIERCLAVKKSLQCQRYQFKVSRGCQMILSLIHYSSSFTVGCSTIVKYFATRANRKQFGS